MKLVAVTGANGMIGRRIIQALLIQGVQIRALVRQKSGEDIKNLEYIVGDVNSIVDINSLLLGVDTVFHCAAEIKDGQLMRAVNVDATKNLADTAINIGVSCFIHVSSAGVIGPSSEAWIDESSACFPQNEYEISKHQAEQVLLDLESKSMRICILRPTNVVDRERLGVLEIAIRGNWKDKLYMFFKGAEGTHLIHAADVAAAAIHLANYEQNLSGTFFVGCDEDDRNILSEVVKMCHTIIGKKEDSYIHLPAAVPYFIRWVIRGKSLHGNSRFSSAKLISTGFKYQLGLDRALLNIIQEKEIPSI